MDWYYAVGGAHKGPVDDEEFRRLVQQGTITSQTLIWREGMEKWQPHGGGTPPPTPGSVPVAETVCAGCGRIYASSDVVSLAGGLYCGACKPLALQRLREGGTATTAVEQMRKEHLKHEASVKSIGVLYYLGGIGLLFVGIGAVISGGARGGGAETIVVISIAALCALLGIGQLCVGAGLRRLKKWARIPTGILSGLGLLGFPLGTIINAYILYLVFSQKGAMVFSDEYRTAIEQTPHIKYRTSIIVWIFLGLLLLLIAMGIIAPIIAGRR
jgi:hypothetical protein